MQSDRLTDKQLVDWLSERQYVEATDDGVKGAVRFQWVPVAVDLRLALSRHIRRVKSRRQPSGDSR